MKNLLQNKKGITLIEVLVASVLIVVMSGALFSAHLAVRHSTRLARVKLEASHIARSYLEREKAKDYSNLTTQTYNNVVLSDNGTAVVNDDVLGTVQVTATTNADGTKTVAVTVSWNHRLMGQTLSAQNVSLTTLVADV